MLNQLQANGEVRRYVYDYVAVCYSQDLSTTVLIVLVLVWLIISVIKWWKDDTKYVSLIAV